MKTTLFLTLTFITLVSANAFAEDCMIKDGSHCYLGMPMIDQGTKHTVCVNKHIESGEEIRQAEANCAGDDLPDPSKQDLEKLQELPID